MLSRRSFLCCATCSAFLSSSGGSVSKAEPEIFCSSSVSPFDAKYFSLGEVNWDSFYLSDVPRMIEDCQAAFGIAQKVTFSDEVALQSTYNAIFPESPEQSLMYLGVGNLSLYPFSTLVAVILHELGHHYCRMSPHWQKIFTTATFKKIELLADFMAGSAFLRLERRGSKLDEVVWGQCSGLEFDDNNTWIDGDTLQVDHRKTAHNNLSQLDSRRLLESWKGEARVKVLRPTGKIDDLDNYAMIGSMPNEDPSERRCFTKHQRKIDFLSMVAAISSWRTFGDRPGSESHGTPSERYEAFASGYRVAKENDDLRKCMSVGTVQLVTGG